MSNKDHLNYLLELLAPLNPTSRRMFGGFGIYCKGQIVGLIFDDQLYFKVDDSNRIDYENAGSQPFTYESKDKTISISYWLVPAEIIDGQDALCTWAEKAYNISLKSQKPKKKRA